MRGGHHLRRFKLRCVAHGWKGVRHFAHAIPHDAERCDAERADLVREPRGLGAHEWLVERDDEDAGAGGIVEHVLELSRAACEGEQLFRRGPEPHEVLVLEHEAQEPMAPLEGDGGELEEPEQVPGRRGVDDHRGVLLFGDGLAEHGERVQLVDPGRGEGEESHLDMLRDKLNAQIAFVESGQIKGVWPHYDGGRVKVEVVARCPLNAIASQFYVQAGQVMTQANMDLCFRLWDA